MTKPIEELFRVGVQKEDNKRANSGKDPCQKERLAMSQIEPSALHRVSSYPVMVDGIETLLPEASSQGKSVSKFTLAYGAVRRAIVTHDLSAMEPLDENELQVRFEVGRTPLREALKRLAHEKFLSWPPHQAPIIRDLSVDELSSLYETRMLIEPRIASLAAQRGRLLDIQRISNILQHLARVSNAEDTYQSVELDFAFHAAVAQATQNRFLGEASNSLNRQSLRLWYRSQLTLGIGGIDRLHSELADAISSGNYEEAEALACHHVERFFERQHELQRYGPT